MSDIVYLKHPVSPEDKKKYLGQGKKILDIVYSPQGEDKEPVKVKDKEPVKVKRKGTKTEPQSEVEVEAQGEGQE